MDTLGLWALFTSSLLASTLLPGGSEVSLAYAAHTDQASTALLWATATLGNTLGGVSSWVLGWWLARRYPRYNPCKPAHRKALERIRRFGGPALLFSWLPLIGDPLCLAAGWAGIRFPPSILFIAFGKGLRYGLLLFMLPVAT